MMKLKIHDLIALLEDIPEQQLERGDVGSASKLTCRMISARFVLAGATNAE
jgi:hypothetical protein